MLGRKNIKLLITSGCSFSQPPTHPLIEYTRSDNRKIIDPDTLKICRNDWFHEENQKTNWAIELAYELGIPAIFEGRGACGNGIISKTIIEATEYALQTYEPDEILVGVMWSGRDRNEFYFENKPPLNYGLIKSSPTPFYRNPMGVTEYSNYYITNAHWDDELSKTYYTNFYDDIDSVQRTLENILRIQWYLKSLKIKYFFTTYHFDSLPLSTKYTSHSDLKTLYKLLDMQAFLPCTDCYDWCVRRSGYPMIDKWGDHPSSEQSLEFSNRVIIPYLRNKNII